MMLLLVPGMARTQLDVYEYDYWFPPVIKLPVCAQLIENR
jgi:hypothetical protein